LEKFFDRVNHDRLMAKLAERIRDKRVLKLIRRFLQAGVMENGLVSPVDEGTPQGGPLSPLLSNTVLDELDRELERRGHRHVRYADDFNIYVRSERAGERVMESIWVSDDETQAQSESGEECDSSPAGTEVLRVQLHRGQGSAKPHCAQSDSALLGANPRADVPDTRDQPRAEGERTLGLLARLARLLRFLPDTLGARRS
jgi:hypothetical protein